MIVGQVNARYEAVIPIKIYDANRQLVELEATVDTGFSGYCDGHPIATDV